MEREQLVQYGPSASTQAKQRPIDAALFRWPSPSPALLASRCARCAKLAFPANPSCMACGGLELREEELPRRGQLWTWTIQRFMPKAPYLSSETQETFAPYGVGYVELPGALRVESRLLTDDPAKLRIGAEMDLTFYTHRVASDGSEIVNYAFRPV